MNCNVRASLNLVLLALFTCGILICTGCATARIDWASRVGTYTYDEAIMDFGPPDKVARLSDGSTVAEWLTRRGYTYGAVPFYHGFYYPYAYGPYYYQRFDTYSVPDAYLRLAFDPENRLKAWRKLMR